MTLDELLRELIAETPDVTEKRGEYSRDGVLFAANPAPDVVEVRLGPDIAQAAMNTGNTGPSSRGQDWVRLATNDWSAAHDRLEAWYRVAWRLAGKRR